MHLEFNYEFEDYTEAWDAQRQLASVRIGGGSAGGKSTMWRLIAIIVVVVLSVMLFMFLESAPRKAPAAPATAPTPVNVNIVDIVLPVIPWLLIFGFVWFFAFRQMKAGKPTSFLYASNDQAARARSATKSGRLRLVLTVFALLIIGGSFLFLMTRRDAQDSPEQGNLVSDFLLPFVPWLLIFLFVWFFVFRQLRGGRRRMWDSQKQLHQAQAMDVTDDGVTIVNSMTRLQQTWDAFEAVRETPNLFMLYTSSYSFHMVPKRAFASGMEIDAFRWVVRLRIAGRPGPAFPVVIPPTSMPPPPLP
jgi:preprotein translocase subunit YajC